MSATRPVAVLDGELLTGLAFVRSLGRAGVPLQLYGPDRSVASRWSRFAGAVRPAPSPLATGELVDWLVESMERGEVDLVAPTSDFVAFAVAEAHRRLGRVEPGYPSAEAVADCLFKSRFADRLRGGEIEAAPSRTPTSVEDALVAGHELGWPVVVKPRSHLGVGLGRGRVVTTPGELAEVFAPAPGAAGHPAALRYDADLAWPLLQRYVPAGEASVVSVTGCLDRDGEPRSVAQCRKVRSWPPALGIGTRFEAVPDQPFTAAAIDVARKLLGVGLFELEVLVDGATGDAWAIDLNPRAWGQIGLDVARGHDRPRQWYETVTGRALPRGWPARRVPPEQWRMGALDVTADLVALAAGPDRRGVVRARRHRPPVVGAVWSGADPGPAVAMTAATLRHPARLVRRAWRHR